MPLKGKALTDEIARQQRANKLIRARGAGKKLSKEQSGDVSSAFNRAIKRKKQQYR